MALRRELWIVAHLMIIMINIFRGETLTCGPAEYEIGNECCPMCHPGSRVRTQCTEFTSTTCLHCNDGTFMDEPTGHRQCYTCTNCDAGLGLMVKTSCTRTSDTVCEPLEGFYCIDPIGNNCGAAQKHRSCQPGQYINQTGTASTDTVCSDCSAGTFSDGTFPSCRPHTQCESNNLRVIKAGTDSTDAECGSYNVALAVTISVICVVLFLLIYAGLFYYFVIRKKEICFNEGRNRNSNDSIVTSLKKTNADEEEPPEEVSLGISSD